MPLVSKNIRVDTRESLLSRAEYSRTSVPFACHEVSLLEHSPAELTVTPDLDCCAIRDQTRDTHRAVACEGRLLNKQVSCQYHDVWRTVQVIITKTGSN